MRCCVQVEPHELFPAIAAFAFADPSSAATAALRMVRRAARCRRSAARSRTSTPASTSARSAWRPRSRSSGTCVRATRCALEPLVRIDLHALRGGRASDASAQRACWLHRPGTGAQELEAEHNNKKAQYDAAMSQYESRVSALENEVRRSACTNERGRSCRATLVVPAPKRSALRVALRHRRRSAASSRKQWTPSSATTCCTASWAWSTTPSGASPRGRRPSACASATRCASTTPRSRCDSSGAGGSACAMHIASGASDPAARLPALRGCRRARSRTSRGSSRSSRPPG